MNTDTKKVGIITLHGLANYGNRLQNYAVQEIIRDKGFCVENITVDKSRFHQLACFIYDSIFPLNLRLVKFFIYEKKNFKDRFVYTKEWCLPGKISEEYDYFVTGSDQVWNPVLRPNKQVLSKQLNDYFLRFAKKHQRIALAPSIAVDYIPDDMMEQFVEGINGFENLSVREKQGAELIKKVTGREATVLIDPTLALSPDKWESIANRKNIRNKKYILTYFLGTMNEDTEKKISNIAKKNNLEIIRLNEKKSKLYSATPDEFLTYIKNAELVFTDSFHGCAFSVIFHVPFIACKRIGNVKRLSGIESRIASLLSELDLLDRQEDRASWESLFQIDYSRVDSILSEKRQEFNEFLNRGLGMVEGNL